MYTHYLGLPYHLLKVNRDFNVNFNLNMKYDSVRGKQKTFNFNITTPLVTYHFSSTSTPPSPPLLSYAFCPPCCFWKFKKIGKRAIICIRNTCFLRFKMKIASPQRPTEVLYLTVNKKLRHSYKQFGFKSCFKMIGKRYKIENT